MNDDTQDVSELGFKKVFVVVFFPFLNEVELVPKNWLFEDKDITKCYWPNVASHKARKMCVRYHQPSSQWKTYTVQVIYETSDLAKGMIKLREAEDKTDVNTTCVSDEDMVVKRSASKRRKKKPRRLVESDEEQASSSSNLEVDLPRLTALGTPEVPQIPAILETVKTPEVGNHIAENFQIDEVPARAEAEEQSERNCFSSSFNRDDHDEKLVSLFGEVRRIRITQIELKQEINSVHQKLDAILSNIGQCPAVAIAPVPVIGCPEEFSFPVGEMRDFEKLESTLECVESQKKLVTYLQRYCSKDPKKSVREMLSCIFTDVLMERFNWLGQRGSKHGLKSSNIVEIINAAVRTADSEVTNSVVKKVIQEYVKSATKRLQRRRLPVDV